MGKRLVAAEEAAGEFTGLARFTPDGAAALRAVWADALARGLDSPFGAAATLRQAYLSDGLNAIAARGVALRAGARRRRLARDRHRAGSGERRAGRRRLAVVTCRAAIPAHWLHRLDAAEWLAAAETELAHAQEKLSRRAVRPGVTHARRAAGMAWNAVLVTAPAPDERYGRSYMDHVVALAQAPADDASIPAEVRAAARLLREHPAAPSPLITIGKPDMSAARSGTAIVAFARSRAGG